MADIVLGIDLGTTNSVVSIADGTEVKVLTDEGGSRLLPSVVSFHPDGRVLVGVEARDRRLVDAPHTVYSIKRLIGRPFRSGEVAEAQSRFAFKLQESANGGVLVAIRNDTFTLTEISAFVLREVKRIAENAIGQPVSKAVITVPAAFNELQRSATKAAGRVAGLEVLRIVNEPTAAALAYGIGKKRKERVAVYDLGGGTFDLTLLELENDVYEVLGSAGDSFLGGDDFDDAIAGRMAESYAKQHRADIRSDSQAYERVRAAAEWIKCELSRVDQARADIEELGYGQKGKALDLSFSMTRAELEALIRPHVERTLEVCRTALREAGLGVSDLDAVIMVGGSTRVPLVRAMVRDFFRLEPKIELDPDLVVSQGAAIHGYAITGGAKKQRSLGRVELKKMTLADMKAVQTQRAESRALGPKQPAFAPNLQIAVPEPPKVPEPPRAKVPVPPPRRAAGPVVPAPAVVPFLPPPKPRPSTLPPKPPHAIEAPSLDALAGGLALDDAFGIAPKPVPRAGAVPRATSGKGLSMELDGAFGLDAEIANEAKELDSAVQRASLAPPSVDLRRLEPARVPAVAEDAEEIDILELDEEIDEPELSVEPVPALPPAVDVADAPLLFEPDAPASPETFFEPEPTPEVVLPDSAATLAMTDEPPPILMDVTPLSLGVETVGGFCHAVIRRNVPIPCEQTRTFTTAADQQTSVTIRICQGESRLMAENQLLGAIELTGLRGAARGEVKIGVTFEIDSSGILDVKAVDETTGALQRTRIHLLGGADEGDIATMRERQQRMVGGRA